MFDYEKLFAEGNVVGVKFFNSVINEVVSEKRQWGVNNKEDWKIFWNNELKLGEVKIQYIIRLDNNGNVVERLFDREKDIKPMPELKTGMFVRVAWYNKNENGFNNSYNNKNMFGLGITITEQNRIYYQNEGYDTLDLLSLLNSELRYGANIVEIYKMNVDGFNMCNENNCIWRHPEYQKYLDSKTNLEDKE